MDNIKFGKVRQVLIEQVGEKIWMVRSNDRILVMVIAASVNLGSLKLKLGKLMKQVIAA